ncbi:hypothetical protein Tsubulata_031547 [Turnera subulata]|uniref:Uncharacterized protein n=1 Tax=Turnera subulata TaxID=218843 RepID=A0A9Q0FMH1_9ROSI|nr:hypothetical protein Tsubulata_031547 [Turnera subulata]
MADSYSLCLIGAMDRLWFQQIILFPESTSLLVPKTLKQHHLLVTESSEQLSSTLSLPTDPPKEEVLSDASSPLPEHDIPSESKPESVNEEEEEEEEEQQERPTRLNPITQRARSHSSSPSSTGKRPKTMRRSSSLRRLKKSMSCRTLGELELEEVRGFMDLGFIFKKEYLSPRMMSVVPGLQRLGLINKNKQDPDFVVDSTGISEDHDKIREEEGEDEKGIIRPYLSEAWLINRPDSPLLSLSIPRVSAAADMKKHLKFWARTVALVVKQEC